jgi:hypothetical protein
MPSAIIARLGFIVVLLVCASVDARAGWDDCRRVACGPFPDYVYVYDHSAGPTWTSNGWSYRPVGVYHPAPVLLAPPPLVRVPVAPVLRAPAPPVPAPAPLK